MITITVDHNSDLLELSVDGRLIRSVPIKGDTTGVQNLLDDFLNRLLDNHPDGIYPHIELESIDEDKRKTINEW